MAAGVRRIEAFTAANGAQVHASFGRARQSGVGRTQSPDRGDARPPRRKCWRSAGDWSASLSEAKKKLAMGGGASAQGADGVRVVGDVKLLARVVEGIEIKDLKSLADEGKKQLGSGVVALVATTADGKASIVVGVTPDLVAQLLGRRSGAHGRPRCWAARAAAGSPTWRRPAVPTAPRPRPRWTRSKARSAEAECTRRLCAE